MHTVLTCITCVESSFLLKLEHSWTWELYLPCNSSCCCTNEKKYAWDGTIILKCQISKKKNKIKLKKKKNKCHHTFCWLSIVTPICSIWSAIALIEAKTQISNYKSMKLSKEGNTKLSSCKRQRMAIPSFHFLPGSNDLLECTLHSSPVPHKPLKVGSQISLL